MMGNGRQAQAITLTLEFFIIALLTSHAFSPLSDVLVNALLFLLAFDAVMQFLLLFSKKTWSSLETYLFLSNVLLVLVMLTVVNALQSVLLVAGVVCLVLVLTNIFVVLASTRRKEQTLTKYFSQNQRPRLKEQIPESRLAKFAGAEQDAFIPISDFDKEFSPQAEEREPIGTSIFETKAIIEQPAKEETPLQRKLLEELHTPKSWETWERKPMEEMPSFAEVKKAEEEIEMLREAVALQKAEEEIEKDQKQAMADTRIQIKEEAKALEEALKEVQDAQDKMSERKAHALKHISKLDKSTKQLQKTNKQVIIQRNQALKEAKALSKAVNQIQSFHRQVFKKKTADAIREAKLLAEATKKVAQHRKTLAIKKPVTIQREAQAITQAFSALGKATADIKKNKIKTETQRKQKELDALIKEAEQMQKKVTKAKKATRKLKTKK
jgi:hypothetical protein